MLAEILAGDTRVPWQYFENVAPGLAVGGGLPARAGLLTALLPAWLPHLLTYTSLFYLMYPHKLP